VSFWMILSDLAKYSMTRSIEASCGLSATAELLVKTYMTWQWSSWLQAMHIRCNVDHSGHHCLYSASQKSHILCKSLGRDGTLQHKTTNITNHTTQRHAALKASQANSINTPSKLIIDCQSDHTHITLIINK